LLVSLRPKSDDAFALANQQGRPTIFIPARFLSVASPYPTAVDSLLDGRSLTLVLKYIQNRASEDGIEQTFYVPTKRALRNAT
jgi:hypothetical protein